MNAVMSTPAPTFPLVRPAPLAALALAVATLPAPRRPRRIRARRPGRREPPVARCLASRSAFVAAFGCTVGAWRAALAAAGARSLRGQAAARLGVGSMVNSFTPAKLGDAVKIALCARAIDAPDRLWTAGGVYAALAAARSLDARRGSSSRLRDRRAAAVAGVRARRRGGRRARRRRRASGRLRSHRLAQLLDGVARARALAARAARVVGWTVGMQLARLGATPRSPRRSAAASRSSRRS